ncbi:adenosylcobalamin-dependent ribonucleoside-diphosphate reductase [Deinococcus sp. Arct2-2]|nr:adenosylcobalamin-dependent ribonucleoside-diphosphate reductase [Deinococcus sp. Arct2-2]
MVAVEPTGRTEEVFCCDEPETHTFVIQGGVLTGNCFVQGATAHDPASFEGVMEVAKKLALVTKVGGGNGVNLDVYLPRAEGSRPDAGVRGWAYMSAAHADVTDFIEGLMRPPTQPDGDKQPVAIRNWTRVVYGQSVPPELVVQARQNGVQIVRALPEGVQAVPDDMGGITDAARKVAEDAKLGLEPRIDLSEMRAEGAPIKGSGGTSSGPVSFLMEIFDNFLEWANRGAEHSGPVNTLRFVYSPVLRVVRQGGCLHPDTLVNTSSGTLRLRELVDPRSFGHQAHALEVATDAGWKHSPEGFNNGLAETLRVQLQNGLTVQGTPNHKLKVLRESGEREWVRLDEVQAGDWAIQVLDQHTGAPVLLEPVGTLHPNAKPVQTPDTLTEELAFWLGYLWGDGFVSGQRLGFSVAHGSAMMEETPRLFRDLFGLELRQEQKENDKSVVFVTRSAALVDWLTRNGLLKGKTLNLEVPRAVRQAPRPVLGAFLRGLFEADGTLLHGYPQLSCASADFAQDVLVLLGGLGIPAQVVRYEAREDRYSQREHYRLNVVSAAGLERYRERVGWLPGSRFKALQDFQPDLARESAWPLPHAAGLLGAVHAGLPAGRKGAPSPFTETRKTLSRYIRGERGLTGTGYSALAQNPQIAAALPTFEQDEYYVQVKEITPGGRILTLDISVDENHTYLAGGLVTHNTRRGAGMATISIDHPDVLDFLTAKGLDREAAEGDISTFNISILVGEKFWNALQTDAVWPIAAQDVPGKYALMPQAGAYDGTLSPLPDREDDGARGVPVYQTANSGTGIPARWLWDQIAQHAWSTGEPGLIFADRVNEYSALKDLGERYQIRSTNPCGEIPLTVGEPCDLGAINLAAYVTGSTFDFAGFRADVRTCVRFLDDVLDVNVFALEDNRIASQDLRRLGLGVMGLADALIKLGLRYDNDAGRQAIAEIMGALREEAIAESERLGAERGVYPVYTRNADKMPHAPRRNVAVLTVAPTGTTSMLMGVSSGIEPVFSPFIWRKIGSEYRALLAPLFVELLETYPPAANMDDGKGGWNWDKVTEAVSENHGSVVGLAFIPDALQQVFVCAHDIAPADHVRMQGTVQVAFDAEGYAANSLSKTINLPNGATVQDVQDAYSEAYRTGCKGITVYRDGSRQFQVLSTSKTKEKKADEAAEAPAEQPATVQAADVMGESLKAEPVTVPAPAPQPAPRAAASTAPVYERPARLQGITDMVKLTDPTSGHRRSFLVTVNHLRGKPVEVMVISGRAGDEANADSEALGRVVSIALQHGVPAQAIIKTLRGLNGGLYGSYNGRLVGSKADLIAVALETFQKDMDAGALPPLAGGSTDTPSVSPAGVSVAGMDSMSRERCPVCEERAVIREEGCLKCQACGYSKCG